MDGQDFGSGSPILRRRGPISQPRHGQSLNFEDLEKRKRPCLQHGVCVPFFLRANVLRDPCTVAAAIGPIYPTLLHDYECLATSHRAGEGGVEAVALRRGSFYVKCLIHR